MKVEQLQEHRWLQRLVGEWEYEHECPAGPDTPAMKTTGRERVRSLGGVWVIAEGEGEMPGGGMAQMVLTIGYDPERGRFVGTWIGSMMTNMWVYDGELDSAKNTLTLNTVGPAMCMEGPIPGKTAKYREIIELKSDDHRVFTSQMQGEDGAWVQIMRADYRRKK